MAAAGTSLTVNFPHYALQPFIVKPENPAVGAYTVSTPRMIRLSLAMYEPWKIGAVTGVKDDEGALWTRVQL